LFFLRAMPDGPPVQDLTWNYPVDGPLREPVAAVVLAEIKGHRPDGASLSAYPELKDDGLHRGARTRRRAARLEPRFCRHLRIR